MLYGKVLRPVSYGAVLKSIELEPARSLEGVVVVRDGDFVGCAAPTSWQASKGLDAIAKTCQWDRPSHLSSDQLFEHLKQTANPGGGDRDRGAWGDRAAARKEAKHQIESRYTIAYIQHAPMEPRAAVAEWDGGGLTVWTGTQQPSRVQGELGQVFRLPSDQVRVIVPDTGGGFGGKHTGEVAVEAARLAKAAGRPVSLRWTREEEFTWAYFRPAGLIEVQAGIDAAGNLNFWDFANYNSGGSAIETPYTVPHGRTRFLNCDSPLRQGSYRALASAANTFARESAMDELAELAEVDPLEFRLRHLADGRLKDVLKAAAEKFQWSDRDRKGRGIGLACGTEKGSFVAACAEVEVVDGKMRVLEVCQAFECGAVQNPGNLEAQHAGALIMGLGGALFEAIEFAGGRITNPSFSSYRVPRMSDVPKLDLVQLDRRDLPSVGAGETPILAVAPAIANAMYRATGVRSRALPLRS
jgi:isoquinoline 1-oxidoreductase